MTFQRFFELAEKRYLDINGREAKQKEIHLLIRGCPQSYFLEKANDAGEYQSVLPWSS